MFGVVKEIHKDALILDRTSYGDGQEVKLQSKTKFIHDNDPSTLAQLKVGDQVYVDVKKDKKSGVMTAHKVVSGAFPTEVPVAPKVSALPR
jgi:hypothetical protein